MTQHEAVERLRELFPGAHVCVTLAEWWNNYQNGTSETRFVWSAFVAGDNLLWSDDTLANVMAQAEAFAVSMTTDAETLAAEADAALAARESEVAQ